MSEREEDVMEGKWRARESFFSLRSATSTVSRVLRMPVADDPAPLAFSLRVVLGGGSDPFLKDNMKLNFTSLINVHC